jgi:hypothetical protein
LEGPLSALTYSKLADFQPFRKAKNRQFVQGAGSSNSVSFFLASTRSLTGQITARPAFLKSGHSFCVSGAQKMVCVELHHF